MNILEVKNLTVLYQNDKVLDNISFNMIRGDYIALVGPNGAGKTTMIKAVLNLINNYSGEIIINTEKVGYVQQRLSLNDYSFPATVFEIVRTGLIKQKKFPRIFVKKDNDKTKAILESSGIYDLKDKMIGKLSGGQLQKVLLARALISDPELLFLDEPTTALDPASRDGFYKTVKRLNEDNKMTIVLITHDFGSAGLFAKKLMYIDTNLVFYGSFEEFCKSTDMTKYFGGYSQHIICHRHDS